MSDILCYIQDTNKNSQVNIDLDVECYSVFKDHLVIEINKPYNEEAFNILSGKYFEPDLYFTLILDGCVYFECQSDLVNYPDDFVSSNMDALYCYKITFSSKQYYN